MQNVVRYFNHSMKISTIFIFAMVISSFTFGQITQPKIDSLVKRKIEAHLYQPQAENGKSGFVILTITKPKDSVSITTSFSSYGDKWYERQSKQNLNHSLNSIGEIIPKGYKAIVPIEYRCTKDSIYNLYEPNSESIKIVKDLLNENSATKPIIIDLKLKTTRAMEVH